MATHDFVIYSGDGSSGYNASLYHYTAITEESNQCVSLATARNAASANMMVGGLIDRIGQYAEGSAIDDLVYIYRGALYFKITHTFTGATIDSAKISFKSYEKNLTDGDFNLVLQDLPDSIPHQPGISSDYNKANYSGNGGSINTSSMTVGSWFDVVLNATGKSWIPTVKDDIFTVGVRSSDDIGAVCPNGFSNIRVYDLSSNAPYLTISIIITIPTATTQAATNVDEGSATLNGTITDNGYWLNSYGFEIKKGAEGSITSYTVGGNSNQDISTFEKYLSGLDAGTTYYYRAWGNNDAGKGYGSWVEFTTEVEVTTQAATEIDYECAMGNGTVTGSNITERGFEIRLDFGKYKDSNSGTLLNYINHSIAGFEGNVTWDIVYQWNGILIKTESETGNFEEGAYELVLGHPSVLGNPSHTFNDKLFKCESYTYRAYAIIDGETYYGDWVAFSTLCDSGREQQPTDDLSEGNPIVPIIPIEDSSIGQEQQSTDDFIWELPEMDWNFDWDFPDYPPWDINLPEIPPWVYWDFPDLPPLPPWVLPDLPDWEIPDYPSMSFVGDFYYRKPYTKKDLDDLRKKCIIYNKNSIELALVLRHNMNVLREFFNMMTDYMDKKEFNDFTDLIPPQRLKELSLDQLDPTDFRDMINEFIRNTIDNNMVVNRNFKLIQEGLSDYETESDNAYFKEINSNMKTITEDNPDVHRLKRVIDNLNQEVSSNFSNIMHNLKIIRARLL